MEKQLNSLMKVLFITDWGKVDRKERVDQEKDLCKELKLD